MSDWRKKIGCHGEGSNLRAMMMIIIIIIIIIKAQGLWGRKNFLCG
jgi:hypothetical protein